MDEFGDTAAEKQFILVGCEVKYIPNYGSPWTNGQMVSCALLTDSASCGPYSRPPIKPTSYPRKKMDNNSQIRGKYLQNMSIKEIIPSIYKEQKHNKNTNNPIKRRENI